MPRRQSLVGPLLLMLLGVLLLVRNFRPEFPFWDLVTRYWPVILVVWGLAKLAGALRAPEPGAPAWRPSLTIGEFFLALLVVLVGLSASKWTEIRKDLNLEGIDLPWSRTYDFTQTLKQPMEPKQTLRVENPAGEVRVVGTDAKELAVNVTKHIRDDSEADAMKIDAKLAAEIVSEGAGYLVRIPGHNRLRADMEISVPRATALRMEVRRGSVNASDLQGEVSAEVDRGDMAVSNVEGNVRARLRRGGAFSARNIKGNVELEGRGGDIQVADVTGQLLVRGEYSGASDYSNIAQGVKFSSSRTEMEIQKLPGRVDMTIGSLAITDPGGAVTVNTRNKDIRVEEFSEKVQIVNHGASVELRTTRLPLKDIEVENHSGPIQLAIPAKSEFQIDAVARRGQVESEFPIEMQRETENGWLKGKVGSAAATIKLNTTYGTINLRKLGVEPEKAGREASPAAPDKSEPRPPAPPKKPAMRGRSGRPVNVSLPVVRPFNAVHVKVFFQNLALGPRGGTLRLLPLFPR